MPRLVLVAAVALAASALFASAAGASRGVQYGVQDDAWLLGGRGHARIAPRPAPGPRRDDGAVQHPLGSGGADEAGARPRRERPGLRVGRRGRGPPGSARARHPAGRDAVRDAEVGERRPQAERRPRRPRERSRTSRTRRRSATRSCAGGRCGTSRINACRWRRRRRASTSTRLLNPAYVVDPSREPPRARRRRSHGASRQHRRRRSARVGSRDEGCAREDRRVRAQPVPDAPEHRVAVEGRVRDVRRDLDGEPRPPARRGAQGLRPQADLADGVRLPDESAGPVARRQARESRPRTSARRRCARTRRRT